jgi:hypothetical protein
MYPARRVRIGLRRNPGLIREVLKMKTSCQSPNRARGMCSASVPTGDARHEAEYYFDARRGYLDARSRMD